MSRFMVLPLGDASVTVAYTPVINGTEATLDFVKIQDKEVDPSCFSASTRSYWLYLIETQLLRDAEDAENRRAGL